MYGGSWFQLCPLPDGAGERYLAGQPQHVSAAKVLKGLGLRDGHQPIAFLQRSRPEPACRERCLRMEGIAKTFHAAF